MNFLLRLYVLICTFLKNINCCSSSWWFLFCNIFISVSNSHFKSNLNDEEMSISRLMWCVNYIINKNCLRDKTITEKYLAKIVSAKNHLVIAIFTILKCLKEYKKTQNYHNLHVSLKMVCFIFCIIIYTFVCQFPLLYHLSRYNQKQWSDWVLGKKCSLQIL